MVEASVVLGGLSVVSGLVYGSARAYFSERKDLDKEYSGSIGVARETLNDEALDPLEDIVTKVVEFEVDQLRAQIDAEHGQTDGGYGESAASNDPDSLLAKALDEQNTTEISLKAVIDSDDYEFDTDVDDKGELLKKLTDDLRESTQQRRRLDKIPRKHTVYQKRGRNAYFLSGVFPVISLGGYVLWRVSDASTDVLPLVAGVTAVVVVVMIILSLYYVWQQRRLNDELVEILRDVDAIVDD